MASGEMPPAEFETFLTIFLIGQATWLDAGAIVFVFMDWRSIDILYAAGRRAGLDLVNLCVWTKTNAAMGNLYRSKHELVAFSRSRAPRTETTFNWASTAAHAVTFGHMPA